MLPPFCCFLIFIIPCPTAIRQFSLTGKSVIVHSVSSNTLRDAQIWGILPHIALAASGFSCFRHENASRYSGLCTVTEKAAAWITNPAAALKSQHTHPFTAPAVIPFTSLSWKMINMMIIGRSVSVRTAMIIGVFMEYWPWNSQIARGRVRFAEDCVSV